MKRAMAIVLAMLAATTVGFCQVGEAPEQAPADDADQQGQVVVMRAVWPDGNLTDTSFRVFEDQQMRQLVDIFPAPDGTAMAVLRPGEYYVMAVVDANGNNQVDAGDGFGFHGVSDLSSGSRPTAAEVKKDALNQIAVPILMTRSEDGRLVPLTSARQATTGTLTGQLEGVSGAGKPTLIIALPIGMQTRPAVTAADADGNFALQAPAGKHRLVAIADADDSGTVSEGDLVATLGTEDAPVTVEADATAALETALTLSADGTAPEGLPPLIAGRITGVEIPEDGRASVAFCTDQALRSEAFSVVAGPDGRYAATAEPGHYYARATIDQAADGRLGVGDMLGFFGVQDLMDGDTPMPIKVGENALVTDVDVAIAAQIDETGRLSGLTAEDEAAGDAENAGE